MPRRIIPLVSGEYYHIFNRSLNRESIFITQREKQRALETLSFYRFANIPVRLSHFLAWGVDRREEMMESLEKQGEKLTEFLAFCLMPNHFHFLLQQVSENGVSKLLSLFQNSYTRYFNSKNKHKGYIFEGQFKAVRIETDEQLLHLSRYIHLNPYSSYVVKKIEDLNDYECSSWMEYIGKREGFCVKDIILSQFRDLLNYQKFVFNQADYQRSLDVIKHIALE